MIETNRIVNGFIALDPLSATQQYISPDMFNIDVLNNMVENKIVLMVEYSNGQRDYVTPDEVIEYVSADHTHTMNVMEQEITVPIINAIVEILSDSYTPQVAVMTTGAKKTATSKLDNLRELVDEMNAHYLPNIEGE